MPRVNSLRPYLAAILACFLLLVSVSCGDREDGSPTTIPSTTPRAAIASLKHPGALVNIEIPGDAKLLGIYEEGLLVYIAMEMSEDQMRAFMNEESLKEQYSKSLTEKWYAMRDWPWWRPNEGVVLQRIGTRMSDGRAIHISANRVEKDGPGASRIRVYVHRFNT